MPNSSAEAFEDGIDLQIGLLAAYAPEGPNAWPGYPLPLLEPSGQQEMRTFRTVVLENPYLRVTILPGLGGRILSLFDKRTGSEVLRRHSMVDPQPSGRRGAKVREGIELWLDGQERLNSVGNVATQIEHSSDDGDDTAVWIAETFTGTGLSFHLRISLPPDRAELQLEARIFNRWLRPQPYNGAISAYLGDGTFDGTAFYSPKRDAGLAVFSNGQLFEGASFHDGVLRYARFAEVQELAPRQVDSWSVTLLPLSGLGELIGASRYAAASTVEGQLRVQVTEQRLGHKLLMLTEEDQTLEAVVDLHPENLFTISLDGMRPVEFVLRDPGKQEIFRAGTERQLHEPLSGTDEFVTAKRRAVLPTIDSDASDLLRATFDLSTRHLAHTLLGIRALSEKRFADAAACFEQALNYNAEDPLLWWAKAVAGRLDEQDNQVELLNAHYLAPLEPALRAESFLCQPISLNPDANPLLEPLAENPEEFIEVACLLIEAGLFDQAGRWIDEALRHRDLPMLRYLMAYCLIAATRLNAEASDHIRIAAQLPIAPPFPYRDIERRAIKTLRQVFPEDESLSTLASFLGLAT